jgi:hypothetical protein
MKRGRKDSSACSYMYLLFPFSFLHLHQLQLILNSQLYKNFIHMIFLYNTNMKTRFKSDTWKDEQYIDT